MRKEESKGGSPKGFPVNLVFNPQHLRLDFQNKIKLQLAFYRSNLLLTTDQKGCKTSPMRFLKSDETEKGIKIEVKDL